MVIKECVNEARRKETREEFKAFMNDTKSAEILIIILKAHLYIERQLTFALTESIVDDSVLKNTTFRQKLDLAYSMGIIGDDYGTLKKFNSIRNAYAHDMDYEFTEKTFDDLIATLSKDDKDFFWCEYEENKDLFYDASIPELNFKLQVLLSDVWFSVNTRRHLAQKAIEIKMLEKKIETMKKYSGIDDEIKI